MYSGTLPASK